MEEKRKNSIEERNHTKFTFDNILRKIKTLAIRSYQKFINNKIKYYLKKNYKIIFSEDVTTKL